MNNLIHCTRCSFEGNAKKFTPGSFWIELILWLMMILPGLIYSIWRLAARYRGCPVCSAKEIVPLEQWRKTHSNAVNCQVEPDRKPTATA